MIKKRTKIPQKTTDVIMVLCKRKCCWCETQEVTEIHHIDQNPSNNEQDNLFPCCSICQKRFHNSTNFVRKITENELKMRRNNFYYKQSPYIIEKIEGVGEFRPSKIKIELIKENV
ncbi:MAG: hypothetical protein AABW47_03705 [Nanoarchaeota archaeon]